MNATPFGHLTHALDEADDPNRTLSQLLRLAADETGGRASVLLETEQGGARCIATAGFGLRRDPAPPLGSAEARVIEAAVAHDDPARLDDLARQVPALASLLGSPAAVVARISQTGPVALLAVGFATNARLDLTAFRSSVASFAVGFEWLRLRRARALQRDVQNLVHGFSQGLSAMPDLTGAFERVCLGAGSLFKARRAGQRHFSRLSFQLTE